MPESIFIYVGPTHINEVMAYLNGNSWQDRFFGGYRLINWQVIPDLTSMRRTHSMYYGILQLERIGTAQVTTDKIRSVRLEKQY